jgi:Domain of unknown function (DUF4129)
LASNRQSSSIRGLVASRRRALPWRQLRLAVLSAGLVFLVALGSGRSFARISPARRLLDVRPAVGDLFVLLVAVLVLEFGLLVYVLVSRFHRRSSDDAGSGRDQSGPWQRLLATLVPLLLLAVLVAAMARRGNGNTTTPISLIPLGTPLPPGSGTGTGSPVVVHWWVLGGLALFGLAGLLVALIVRRRRRRKAATPALSTERKELRAAVDVSLEELEDDADPRRAVINAYANMERVLSEHGLPRRPHETPLEYLARWTAVLEIGRAAAEALALLYERARFSLHVIDEEMRREATAALGALRRELRDEAA